MAELARVTIWIGEIQWMLNHGYDLNRNPVLKPLETIEEAEAAGAIVAYPPTRQGDTGTWAIYILGDLQVGLWQV